jgi:stage V sporulation protein D (sporulation-specific penicillin-binding protein)
LHWGGAINYVSANKLANGKYISSFIGIYPASNPKYLALVIIDEPVGEYYGSTVAAPYAKQVFEGIISLKNLKPI